MIQQNLSGRNYEFQEPTLRREPTVRRENLSGESHGDREEFQLEETKGDAEARKDFLVYSRRFHVSSSYWTDKFNCTCREKNHILFHWVILIVISATYADLEIAQRSEFMTIGISFCSEICQIRGRVSRDLRYWAKFLKKDITNRRGEWRKFKRHHVQIMYGLMEGQEMGK